jgi:hypothetical protein
MRKMIPLEMYFQYIVLELLKSKANLLQAMENVEEIQ